MSNHVSSQAIKSGIIAAALLLFGWSLEYIASISSPAVAVMDPIFLIIGLLTIPGGWIGNAIYYFSLGVCIQIINYKLSFDWSKYTKNCVALSIGFIIHTLVKFSFLSGRSNVSIIEPLMLTIFLFASVILTWLVIVPVFNLVTTKVPKKFLGAILITPILISMSMHFLFIGGASISECNLVQTPIVKLLLELDQSSKQGSRVGSIRIQSSIRSIADEHLSAKEFLSVIKDQCIPENGRLFLLKVLRSRLSKSNNL